MDQIFRRSLDDVRIGFVISHPFQFFIYAPLIRALKNPLVVIETRKKTPFQFSPEFLDKLNCPYVILDETQLKIVDAQVDVIFVMTPKQLGTNFPIARKVLMQYGMAKEFYNYGLWRCNADLNMMFGPHSTKQVEGHCVARSVGNTRLDGYVPALRGGGGLLYLPTYGELSTLSKFADILPKLNPRVPIKIKLHHASEFDDAAIIARLKEDPRITLLDGYRDALDDISQADIVLSDYSGAIFDALFLERPLAMFQPGYNQTIKRTDDRSIEIDRAADLGEVLVTDEDLIGFFDRVAEGNSSRPDAANLSEFLANRGAAVPVALDLLDKLINDEIQPSLVHQSIRETYRKLSARPTKQQMDAAVAKIAATVPKPTRVTVKPVAVTAKPKPKPVAAKPVAVAPKPRPVPAKPKAVVVKPKPVSLRRSVARRLSQLILG